MVERTPSPRTAVEVMVDELCAALLPLRRARGAGGALRSEGRAVRHARVTRTWPGRSRKRARSRSRSRPSSSDASRSCRRWCRRLGGPPFGAPRGWRANSDWIADRLGDRLAERVRTRAKEVRDLIGARGRNAAIGSAADALARHLQGIIRTVDPPERVGRVHPRGVAAAAPRRSAAWTSRVDPMTLTNAFNIGHSAAHGEPGRDPVTGHNLANIGTPGYTRQVARIVPLTGSDQANGVYVGRGVRCRGHPADRRGCRVASPTASPRESHAGISLEILGSMEAAPQRVDRRRPLDGTQHVLRGVLGVREQPAATETRPPSSRRA